MNVYLEAIVLSAHHSSCLRHGNRVKSSLGLAAESETACGENAYRENTYREDACNEPPYNETAYDILAALRV